MKKLLLLFFSLLTIGISSATAADKTFTATVKGATATFTDNSTTTFETATVKTSKANHIESLEFGVGCPVTISLTYGTSAQSYATYNTAGDFRVYAHNTMVIKGINGNKIKKLVFTMTTSKDKWTTVTVSPGSGEATLDDNKNVLFYTWNAPETGAVSEVSFTPGKQFTFKSFEVTYEEGEGGGDEPSELTLSGKYGENVIADGATVTVDKGTEFTFTASEAAMFTLDGEALNTEAATTATWTATEVCADKAVTVTATAGDKSASLSFSLTVKPTTGWELVTSESMLEDGDVITFIAKEYTGKSNGTVTYPTLLMKALDNDVINCQEYTFEDNQFDVEPYAITLHKDGEKWTMTTQVGKYLSAETNKKVKEVVEITDDSSYTITVGNDGNAVVESQGTTKRKLKYNPNIKNPVDITSARFSFYESTTMQPVYMYRKIRPVPPAMPEFKVNEVDNKLVLTCTEGKLWVAEEDIVGEPAEEQPSETVKALAPLAAEDVADHDWVEANRGDQRHEIDLTNLQSDKMVYAKVVHGDTGLESPVLALKVLQNGTISGVEGVAVDTVAGEAVYYDLQGRKVVVPVAGGLYIRVMDGKARKVIIR